jgi:hypothetical protein
MIATDTGPVDVSAVLTPPDGPGDVAAVLNGPPVPDVIIIPPPPTPVDDAELGRRQTNDIG